MGKHAYEVCVPPQACVKMPIMFDSADGGKDLCIGKYSMCIQYCSSNRSSEGRVRPSQQSDYCKNEHTKMIRRTNVWEIQTRRIRIVEIKSSLKVMIDQVIAAPLFLQV